MLSPFPGVYPDKSAVKKAILGMNMKVNETHCNTLIKNSMEEPLLPQLVKLVSPYA